MLGAVLGGGESALYGWRDECNPEGFCWAIWGRKDIFAMFLSRGLSILCSVRKNWLNDSFDWMFCSLGVSYFRALEKIGP